MVAYVPDIKNACVQIFRTEHFSDVLCSTFPVISKCLEIAIGNAEVIRKMDILKLVEEYFVTVNQSKTSATCNKKKLEHNSILFCFISVFVLSKSKHSEYAWFHLSTSSRNHDNLFEQMFDTLLEHHKIRSIYL